MPEIDMTWWEYPGHVRPGSKEAAVATYELIEDGQAMVCHECGAVTTDPVDVAGRECAECGTRHELAGEDIGTGGQVCPASGQTALYLGGHGSNTVPCPGCGRRFPLLEVWEPPQEGYNYDEGRVRFPEHTVEAPAPQPVVHPQQPPVREMRRQRYGGVTSRRYRP